MSRKFGWVRFLFMLLFIGLLVGGGIMLFQSGWSQGFLAGTASSSVPGSGQVVPPYYWHMPGHMGFGHPFGWFGGIFFFFLFLFVIGGAFRMMAWRRWAGHGPWKHGHTPPWAQPEGSQPPAPPEQKDQPSKPQDKG